MMSVRILITNYYSLLTVSWKPKKQFQHPYVTYIPLLKHFAHEKHHDVYALEFFKYSFS
jgi:hypothetical protein